jgi:hypothetical protein
VLIGSIIHKNLALYGGKVQVLKLTAIIGRKLHGIGSPMGKQHSMHVDSTLFGGAVVVVTSML